MDSNELTVAAASGRALTAVSVHPPQICCSASTSVSAHGTGPSFVGAARAVGVKTFDAHPGVHPQRAPA